VVDDDLPVFGDLRRVTRFRKLSGD
jgi:hypothetical protein